jgi:hypothetical protein
MSRLSASIFLVLSFGCAPATLTASQPTPTGAPLPLTLLYPKPDTVVTMGQSTTFIVASQDPATVLPESLSLRFFDPAGDMAAVLQATAGPGPALRTPPWTVPHRARPGAWRVEAGDGEELGRFRVAESTSEKLLGKYGFWIAVPSFHGIVTDLVAEKGDARDGMVRIGGVLPSQHVLPEEWIEIHWRSGDYGLQTAQGARAFLLDQIGDFGVTPEREVGVFEPFVFKGWPAWKATARGPFRSVGIEWVVLYVPETQQTFAIGTTLVLPPSGDDPHARLRQSFEIHPEIRATGVAPDPLPRLIPAPSLIRPGLGESFVGADRPITLEWAPAQPLAEDQFYEVSIDYNYDESSPRILLTTREASIQVPPNLFTEPNCHVFNWQVTVLRPTGMSDDGQPRGEPVSFASFYRYFLWTPPPDQPAPFLPLCPNSQY